MKKVGFIVSILSVIVFIMLYGAIISKKLTIAYFMYFFVGIVLFSILTWLLCACSKIYNGKFESFSVAAQIVGGAMFLYDILFILF